MEFVVALLMEVWINPIWSGVDRIKDNYSIESKLSVSAFCYKFVMDKFIITYLHSDIT